jgi:peptidoglycan/LPS O-acetylase OafA/YrhL
MLARLTPMRGERRMATTSSEEAGRFTLATETRLGYRPALDGIRAIAVVPVMIFHMMAWRAPGGFSGVRVFFVLSGFLISTLLLEEWADKHMIRLGAFYVRRALRLLPALFLLLAVYLIAVAILDGTSAVRHLFGNTVTVVLYVSNWRLVAVGHGGAFTHLWSLSVEEQFYLLWPIGLVLLLRFCKLRTTLIITAVVAAGSWILSEALTLSSHTAGLHTETQVLRIANERHAYYGTDAVACALLAGCLVAILRSSGRFHASEKYPRWIANAGFVGVVLYAFEVFWPPAYPYREVGLLMVVVASLGMILAAVDAPKSLLAQLLSTAPMRAIGRVSYALYLWHLPMFFIVRSHVDGLGPVGRTLVASALTAIAAVISYKLVEQPCLRLKQRFVADKLAAGHP